MDMEICLKVFDTLKKPDIVILERNRGDEDTHIPSMGGKNGKMLYIIEVKKLKDNKFKLQPAQSFNNLNNRLK